MIQNNMDQGPYVSINQQYRQFRNARLVHYCSLVAGILEELSSTASVYFSNIYLIKDSIHSNKYLNFLKSGP